MSNTFHWLSTSYLSNLIACEFLSNTSKYLILPTYWCDRTIIMKGVTQYLSECMAILCTAKGNTIHKVTCQQDSEILKNALLLFYHLDMCIRKSYSVKKPNKKRRKQSKSDHSWYRSGHARLGFYITQEDYTSRTHEWCSRPRKERIIDMPFYPIQNSEH